MRENMGQDWQEESVIGSAFTSARVVGRPPPAGQLTDSGAPGSGRVDTKGSSCATRRRRFGDGAGGWAGLAAWRQVELGVRERLLDRRNTRGVTHLALLDAVFGSEVLRLVPPPPGVPAQILGVLGDPRRAMP